MPEIAQRPVKFESSAWNKNTESSQKGEIGTGLIRISRLSEVPSGWQEKGSRQGPRPGQTGWKQAKRELALRQPKCGSWTVPAGKEVNHTTATTDLGLNHIVSSGSKDKIVVF